MKGRKSSIHTQEMAADAPPSLSVIALMAFLFAMSSLLDFPELTSATSKQAAGVTRHYHFDIKLKKVTRLCHTKTMVTVNGKFPGPKIVLREGDRLVVKVANHAPNNITIHWHGVRQLTSVWADGAAYVTQCPIQRGQRYLYNFTIAGQRGTLFWHAHFSWLRATVYGALIILPRPHDAYPFPKPYKQVPIIFGEWWNTDPEAVISEALRTGNGPNVSDAFTINGLPGPFYNCSKKDTFRLKVKAGKTYLLRLINAAINEEFFFSIANHSLEVVEADAAYIKPFETDVLVISPGQTTNVLLKAKPHYPNASFFMFARPYFTGSGTFDNSTLAGILEYEKLSDLASSFSPENFIVFKPTLPPIGSTCSAANFSKKFRSLGSAEFPTIVPKTVDRRFFLTTSLGTLPCPKNQTCQGPGGAKFAASVNNISFALPKVALLQAYFYGQSDGVFTTDFPPFPFQPFNYTGRPPINTVLDAGTKVVVLPYNTSVEIVLQGTCTLGAESHPVHIHGFNLFVVGEGFGNYDPEKGPANFNLVDPVQRNTVDVPPDGWVAVRFLADNPGVWLMHCHFDIHMSWGLTMAWIVQDGALPNQKLPPPPSDLPLC